MADTQAGWPEPGLAACLVLWGQQPQVPACPGLTILEEQWSPAALLSGVLYSREASILFKDRKSELSRQE